MKIIITIIICIILAGIVYNNYDKIPSCIQSFSLEWKTLLKLLPPNNIQNTIKDFKNILSVLKDITSKA